MIQNSQKSFPFFLPLLISAVLTLLWLIPFIVLSLKEKGSGAGIWGLFSIVAIFGSIIAPVVYGWKTRNTKGAVLIGVLPFLFTMTVPRVLSGAVPRDTVLLVNAVLSIVSLSAIGGLEGYFASRQRRNRLSWR